MRFTLAVAGLLVLFPTLRAAQPAALSTGGSPALSGVLSDAISHGVVPGVAAIVVSPDRVLYHEAFGKMNVARGEVMRNDSIFRIASMTKAVTSVGFMMLVEQKKLSLDDEVSKYLPAFKNPKVLATYDLAAGTFNTRPATHPITIRELLTHTSGIGYTWSDPGLALVQQKTGLADLDLPLVNDPGAQWTYGASTRVIGQLIETLTGQPLETYLEARIMGPLGMHDTFYTVPEAKYGRVVTAHQKADGKITEAENPSPIPATIRGDGGLFSTTGDYGRFIQMLLNRGQLGGVRILREATVREMSRNQTDAVKVRLQPTANPLRSRQYPLGAGEDVWGLGFQIASPVHPSPDMRRPGSMSWAGIYNTFFWIDPEKQIGAVLMMQMLPFYDEGAIGVLKGFERQLYTHLD